ncbi:MAG: potassium-transporting ATPase subunit F [Candidatus Malihini olakiniferum]
MNVGLMAGIMLVFLLLGYLFHALFRVEKF